MDERKKILLGDKDILTRKIKDFYLDINLSKDNKEILPQKYDNVFDVNKFYEQERNECRNFTIQIATFASSSFNNQKWNGTSWH